jgi:hypothetical protein
VKPPRHLRPLEPTPEQRERDLQIGRVIGTLLLVGGCVLVTVALLRLAWMVLG